MDREGAGVSLKLTISSWWQQLGEEWAAAGGREGWEQEWDSWKEG